MIFKLSLLVNKNKVHPPFWKMHLVLFFTTAAKHMRHVGPQLAFVIAAKADCCDNSCISRILGAIGLVNAAQINKIQHGTPHQKQGFKIIKILDQEIGRASCRERV